MCLKGTSVSAGDDNPSSTCSGAVNLRNDSADVWRSVRGGISIISCYGRQMTLWEEQWAASSLFDCQINKVAMNFVSTWQSAWRQQGRPLRGEGRGRGGAAVWLNYGVCMEIFQTSCLHLKPRVFLLAAADSCSLAQAFGWDAFENTRWPWERDGWCDESDAKGHFSTAMFSQPSSPGLDSRKGGFSKKKKEAKKQKTTSLAKRCNMFASSAVPACLQSAERATRIPESVPQSQLLPSHFVTMWIPKPVKRR